jgi:iron(III) transport system ATP-binding protein
MIAGFEPLQSGTIALAGRTVVGPRASVPPEQRSVGMVFQDFALFPHLSVEQNVAFGLQKVADSAQIKTRTAEAIAQVRLQGLESRYPYELSGGQQQRVALARALAPRPALILLDEPLSNLDVQVRLRLREEIREVLKSAGISGVFVTHDQEEALAISDQVAVMQQGRLEQIGTPEEVYHHPASRFVAEFVTQANFISAQRQGQLWQTEVGNFKLPPNERLEADVGDLMVRQEDLLLSSDPESSVVIRDRHFLGREYCYCLSTASGRELHARTTTAVNLPIGTRVQLSVPEQALRIFSNVIPKLAKTL